METAHENDWSEDLQNTHYNLLPLQSEGLRANIKLILHKAVITSVITYACPAWELAADTDLLIQRLQSEVLRNIGNF
jgi:hypothetical protein